MLQDLSKKNKSCKRRLYLEKQEKILFCKIKNLDRQDKVLFFKKTNLDFKIFDLAIKIFDLENMTKILITR